MVEALSIQTIEKHMSTVEKKSSWMDEILYYKRDGKIVIDLAVAQRVKHGII